jgi:hypothetical protein
VLRRIFRTLRLEMTRRWRKLHEGELHNFYYSPNGSLRRSFRGGCVRVGHLKVLLRNAYRILVGKREERPLGRYRHIKKVKLSLFLTKHHTIKAYWGEEV